MAILKILKYGDAKLRQNAKNVTKFSKKIKILVENMFDTMYANAGVGLAATQVGEPFKIFVIDIAQENERPMPIAFINPKIIQRTGAMNSLEGCLSFPGVYTYVRRYASVLIKAQDIKGKYFTLQTDGNSLLSKAIQHEYDHLSGVLFVDHARDIEETNKLLNEYDLQGIEIEKIINEDELEEEIKIELEKNASEIQETQEE